MPSFLKVDGFIAKTITLKPEKLKFVTQATAGVIRPVFGSKSTTINDRFFITNSLGYSHLGHTHPSSNPVDIPSEPHLKYNKQIVGDDLGSENYLLLQSRLEFLDILGIRSIGLRAFTYAEAAFYPSVGSKDSFLK